MGSRIRRSSAAGTFRCLEAMARKKQPLPPRRLRMKRGGRLSSAQHWLATQKNRTSIQIAKSYRKRYGVDWPCAIRELALLGVALNRNWVEQLNRSLARPRLRPARGVRQFDRAGCGIAGFGRLAYGGTEDLMRGRMPWRDQHTAFAFPLGHACEENSF